MRSYSIAGRAIGLGHPCFIIAEAGVNHNGDPALALKLVDVAADMGADAVKFQTFSAEKLASQSAQMADYQKRNTEAEESQFAMLKKLELSRDAYPALLQRCRERGIVFLSSPFEEESADFLETCDVAAFKIPSGEITNIPYLRHIAAKNRPMIVSTGMATMAEIAAALDEIRASGNSPISLLQCYSDYPARPEYQNLRVMNIYENAFGVPAGFSDHTEGYAVTAAAIALGARLVEKHFTLDRNLPGPDHKASLSPQGLRDMVQAIRDVEAALGDGIKQPRGTELNTRIHARKSIVARRDIPAGKVLEASDMAVQRPGTGLASALLPVLVGRRAASAIAAGTLLTLESLT